MYCGNLVGTLITTVVGTLKGSAVDNALMTYATESNMIVTFIYMVICAPILEEYIFRKLIVDRTVKYGQGVAIVLSGLMFGLFHGNLNQFAYAFLLGMFLAFLYVKTGNLKITIGYEYDKDLFHWHEPGAHHNEAAWAARVSRPLKIFSEIK